MLKSLGGSCSLPGGSAKKATLAQAKQKAYQAFAAASSACDGALSGMICACAEIFCMISLASVLASKFINALSSSASRKDGLLIRFKVTRGGGFVLKLPFLFFSPRAVDQASFVLAAYLELLAMHLPP